MKKATDILREYGQSIRGDWGSIDGRTVRMELDELADLIEKEDNANMSEMDAMILRSSLGICISGKGHWVEYCEEDCLTEEELYDIVMREG